MDVYCVLCGAQNPDYGRYCHHCGEPLLKTQPPTAKVPHGKLPQRHSEQQRLLALLGTDPKPNQCHLCGTTENLTRYRFGLAKVISVRRAWSDTIFATAISAVSFALAPVIGYGGVCWQGPDKTTTYRVLRSELVVCQACLSEAWKTGEAADGSLYSYHPWVERARQLGYKKLLSASDLDELRPLPSR